MATELKLLAEHGFGYVLLYGESQNVICKTGIFLIFEKIIE